jgi:AcrR family transcriptional regulator
VRVAAKSGVKPSRRRQVDRRADAESKLISAAITILVEKGYDRLTLADVSVTAGFSRSLPMHYFGNKTTLLTRAAEHIISEIIARAEPKRRNSGPLGLVFEAVRSLVVGIVEDEPNTRALMVVLGAAVVHEGLSDAVRELDRTTLSWIAGELNRGILEGSIRKDIDVNFEAASITAFSRGLINLYIHDRSLNVVANMDYILEEIRGRLSA